MSNDAGDYYSISKFLAESEPVQFETSRPFHNLGQEFDPKCPFDDLPDEKKITIPFWLCKALTLQGLGTPLKSVHGIFSENTHVWSRINAEPKIVNLSEEYSDSFFELASMYGKLLMEAFDPEEEEDDDDESDSEDDHEEYEAGKELVEKARAAFKSRFSKMIVESFTVGSKEPSFKEEYLTRMERELFRIGRESCEAFTRWKYQTSERMEACLVVMQAKKRSQMKRKIDSGRNAANGGALRPRNF